MVVPPNPDCTVRGAHPVPPASREFGANLAELVSSLTAEAALAGPNDASP